MGEGSMLSRLGSMFRSGGKADKPPAKSADPIAAEHHEALPPLEMIKRAVENFVGQAKRITTDSGLMTKHFTYKTNDTGDGFEVNLAWNEAVPFPPTFVFEIKLNETAHKLELLSPGSGGIPDTANLLTPQGKAIGVDVAAEFLFAKKGKKLIEAAIQRAVSDAQKAATQAEQEP